MDYSQETYYSHSHPHPLSQPPQHQQFVMMPVPVGLAGGLYQQIYGVGFDPYTGKVLYPTHHSEPMYHPPVVQKPWKKEMVDAAANHTRQESAADNIETVANDSELVEEQVEADTSSDTSADAVEVDADTPTEVPASEPAVHEKKYVSYAQALQHKPGWGETAVPKVVIRNLGPRPQSRPSKPKSDMYENPDAVKKVDMNGSEHISRESCTHLWNSIRVFVTRDLGLTLKSGQALYLRKHKRWDEDLQEYISNGWWFFIAFETAEDAEKFQANQHDTPFVYGEFLLTLQIQNYVPKTK